LKIHCSLRQFVVKDRQVSELGPRLASANLSDTFWWAGTVVRFKSPAVAAEIDTEDLLRQLLELAMAIQDDYQRFDEMCRG
jgi:hypothetical protein